MIIFDDTSNIDAKNKIISVGSYDGVHLGHRFLIKRLNEESERRCLEPLILTFNPSPKQFFGTSLGTLSSIDEQLLLLEEAGARNVLILPFNESFSRLSSLDFVREILKKRLNVSAYVMGKNHFFGHERKGDSDVMKEEGIEAVMLDLLDEISSTDIRGLISVGKIELANKFLGGKGYLIKSPVTDKNKLLPPACRLYDALVDDKHIKVDINRLPDGIIRLLK